MKLKVLILFVMLGVFQLALAKVKLPKIFSDNMILQRNKPVKIWGWSDSGKIITVTFNQQSVKATTNKQGQWEVLLKPMPFGGPYEMVIDESKGQKETLHNILIGDVWICSGQSNMEMPIQGWGKDSTLNATREIKAANHTQLRLFTVQKATSFTPSTDLEGGNWQECTPGSAASFSAVAYYFGRKLNQDLNIPIGLVNTSWGGTNIQTWISWDEMGKQEEYKNIKLKDIQHQQEQWENNRKKYNDALKNDPGVSGGWYMPDLDVSTWKKIKMPQTYEQSEIGNADGIVWYRKDFDLSASQLSSTSINLGVIDDVDETYINGKLVGKMDNWYTNRKYDIQDGILHAGKNCVVVKVMDVSGGGGFLGAPKDLFLKTGIDQISLSGEWLYKPSVTTTQFDVHDKGPNSFPSQLYNAMVAPMINFSMKGVIWYQGEANTWEASRYQTLFPTLINDWRNKWHDNFPFLWVQLANFKQPSVQPAFSDWAQLREAQHSALSLSQTGEAVIIDIGDANDIHPKNKNDVGDRLALAALKVTYQKDVIHSGPVFQSMSVTGNKIEIKFTQLGSGLVAKGDKYGYLKGFSIAGSDHHFVWAQAYIKGNNVVVFSNEIEQPVAVRYAWSDNPDDANLYNKEGLPASPFRTDDWKDSQN
jgi:sialate O-acetylesterase